jgi:glycosyltransferase involved in cell wall biosynthesis
MTPSVIHLRSSIGMYGAEQVVLGLCQEQTRRGIDSSIVAFSHDSQQHPALLTAAAARGLQSFALPCTGPIDTGAVQRLRRLLVGRSSAGADVLHCHDYKSIVYGFLASAGLPIARVATLHGWLRGAYRLRLYRWLELRMLRGFDRICAVSGSIEQDLLDAGLDAERIRRVDNGIDTDRFRPLPDAPGRRPPAAPIEIGCAARLSGEKNLAQLIWAVDACRTRGRHLHLTIHGDGPLRDELTRLVARLGLEDQVRMPGESVRLERWYPTLDAFVLPSLSEGMPMTVLEAMACGCPVIGSSVGAIPDLLAGVPGCTTVPPGDQDALVEALMETSRRTLPRSGARERVCAQFGLAPMAERYEQIYREALERRVIETVPAVEEQAAAAPAPRQRERVVVARSPATPQPRPSPRDAAQP